MTEKPSRKFVSYNTSYVNDAHYTQVLGNAFMSESAAVVRKAMKLSGNESHYLNRIGSFEELNDFFKTEDKFPNLKNIKEYNDKIVKLIDEDITVEDIDNLNVELLEQLGSLRMCMADAATNYIKTVLEGTPDCVALIEQMIHVPKGHQAFYGGTHMKSDLSNNFDNSTTNKGKNKGAIGKNHFFGILRRINILKILGVNICDIDFDKRNLNVSDYYIVYDNIVNISTVNFSPAPAEGIALIVKKTVCPELFEWNVEKLPLKSKLNKDNNPFANYKFTGNVHYYSDDFGNVVSSYKTLYAGTKQNFIGRNLFRFRTSTRGTPDLGRPIILTAGINGANLNIFVALHNANLFNLAYLGDDFYDSNSNFKDLLTTSGDVNGKYVTGQDVDYNGQVSTKARKLGDIAKEHPDHSDLVALYSSVIDNIGVFITNALSLTNSDNTKPRKINLYLGGDFNDPKGGIFKLLTQDNLPIKIKIYGKVQSIYIQSKYDDTLLSCCANLDSQNPLYQKGFDKALTGDLKTAFDRVVKDDPEKNYEYPPEFIDNKNFGYFGDYAFIGSQTNPPIPSYQVKLDNDSSAFVNFGINSAMASDHLPVYATVVTKGGRRRRYSRVLKRNTKKGLPKKLRASRRKRRAYTYKKH